MRSRRRALSASLSGARHGLVPMRKGQLGHLTAAHLRTSSLEPPQQSRQCARIAAAGAIGACPSARSSSGPIFRGSRPICRPSDPVSVPNTILTSHFMRIPPACCQAKGRPSAPSRSRKLAFPRPCRRCIGSPNERLPASQDMIGKGRSDRGSVARSPARRRLSNSARKSKVRHDSARPHCLKPPRGSKSNRLVGRVEPARGRRARRPRRPPRRGSPGLRHRANRARPDLQAWFRQSRIPPAPQRACGARLPRQIAVPDEWSLWARSACPTFGRIWVWKELRKLARYRGVCGSPEPDKT